MNPQGRSDEARSRERAAKPDSQRRGIAVLYPLGYKARIAARIRRISFGNLGDVRSVGGGISEMRIDYGPGYRVYFMGRADRLIVLLCAGDKSTQDRDIERAKAIAQELKDI